MSNSPDSLALLSARIARLEQQNRWLKLGGASIAVLAGMALFLGAARDTKPPVIEAAGFIMRDANNVPRVEITRDGFFINNEDGKHRISIFAGKEGGTGIGVFADDTYKKQVLLGMQPKLNFCGITVNDDKGTNRIFLNTVNGKPKLELQDETGKPFFVQSQP
ncbi:MAG: hypothetical protein SFX18_08500 [Pirellulales bacterium]|nr:hypothetical protein [Pirellulales bacterium]